MRLANNLDGNLAIPRLTRQQNKVEEIDRILCQDAKLFSGNFLHQASTVP